MMAASSGRCLVLAAVFAVAGCSQPEEIRVHDEAPSAIGPVPPIPADQKQFHTLVAMVPVEGAENGWWFLKLSGPTPVVNKYESDFDKLFNTISTTDDRSNPITWELPPGWTQDPPNPESSRYATLKPPGGEVELTVTRFGGSVMANAQRWWGDLWGPDKAQDFTPAMIDRYVQKRSVKGRLILRVDLYGPKEPPKRGMMMNPHGGGM